MPYELFDKRWPFLQAVNYTPATRERVVTLLVLHTMEDPDRPDDAEGVSRWFAGKLVSNAIPVPAPQASAHICFDQNSAVQCVLPKDVAWGAGGSNWCAWHMEHAGRASWSRDLWLSDPHANLLRLSGEHLRLASEYFTIPRRILTYNELADCIRDAMIAQGKLQGNPSGNPGGVCQHRDINHVWRNHELYGLPAPTHDISHSDCGDGFPADVILAHAEAFNPPDDVQGSPV